ncbi:hypothetical protein TALC_01306 [Thermoplasmatales archaeon BRNA1]|nr:hypothetical protein TALC_01306 [Thermoplasmatales archaeon BRNA1]
MFNILGEEALYLDIAPVFEKNLLALVKDDEKGIKFKEIMKKTDLSFMLNAVTEESCFIFKVPDECEPDDIQLMADVIIASLTEFGRAPVTVDGAEQKYRIIVSNNHEPELLGIHKTPGMSSMEVFKPIIEGWTAPGRYNTHFDN